MPTDYEQISAENVRRYGTEVSYYGSDFADRYTERTHFIYELLQNAEDALRWRQHAEPTHEFPRSVSFRLFADHLEVSHFGLPFTGAHVRAICSIKRGTKETSLTDLGKFGIGFKSVYAFTKHPEIHSGDEHFTIDSYVHPRAIVPRETSSGATLFYIPFDSDEITPAQAHAEISARLGKLGFRTLLFLNQIESVDWEIVGERSGSYLRKAEARGPSREVTLVGQLNDRATPKPLDQQRWLVFSRPVLTAKAEPAGHVEVAFRLTTNAKKDSIVRTDDSTLSVFFPTEKETRCGFLIQGPYKTTPSRDNVPHDNKWNAHLVSETATLVSDTLTLLGEMQLASVGLLQSMPLFREWEVPDDWMLRPVYDAVVATLKGHPLIPAAGGRLVAGKSARIARSRALVELFSPQQLSLLLGRPEEKLDWVSPEISEGRSSTADVIGFLRDVLGAAQIEPEQLPGYLDEDFFVQQTTAWMAKFYAFLLDHERLWRRQHPRGALLARPFIRLQDNRQIAPFRSDGTPNVYLPSDTESEFDTIHRLLAKPRKCAEFLRKLGLTEPDVTTEVLQKVVPQYEHSEIAVTEKKHATNLRKIFRALGSNSPSRPLLIDRLKKLTFLKAMESGTNRIFFCTPGHTYFRTKSLETFFEHYRGALFLAEPEELVRREKIGGILRELGVHDRPRRVVVQTDDDWKKKRELLQGGGNSRDIYFHQYDIEGLSEFLRALRKLEFPDASRRARLLWDFLLQHLSASPPGNERLFFRGDYSWYYYTTHTRSFDAFFLTLLRSKAWLPGIDGELHRPTELLPQELAPGFTRHPILCEELQMKAEVLVNLAKQAGIKVEDLVFIRQNRELFESLKKSIKDKQIADSRPVHSGPNGEVSAQPSGAPVPPNDASGPRENHDHRTPHDESLGGTRSDSAPTGPDGGAQRADGAAMNRESSQDGTYFTYVYVAHEANPNDPAPTGDTAERAAHRASLGRAGLEAVMAFERTAGRHPTEMPLTHEGYDVESRDESGEVERYIEVKSISAEWGARGVTLSSPQFEAARQHKGKYWLYVVDNVNTDKMQIHRIFSPGELAKSYVYDRGWRQLREP